MDIGFRGLIASASLKLRQFPSDESVDSGFRGLIASASLKQCLGVVLCNRGTRFPRLDCLGLIEADNLGYW